MKQAADQFTRDLIDAPRRGRPRKPDALTPAERARRYRANRRAARQHAAPTSISVTGERTISLDDMPFEPWPSVPGIHRGMVVVGVPHGRRFRVLASDEWVVQGSFDRDNNFENRTATGPFAKLQALDDAACTVVWARAEYEPEDSRG